MDYAKLVKLARRIAETWLSGKEPEIPEIDEEAGVFVTLKTREGKLRGCIGVPLPKNLGRALVEATIGALNDPRFPPVKKEELPNLIFEVTVLSPPEPAEPEEIVVGKHGVIVSYGPYSGLLLPQVPVEYGWDRETFLDHACLKAGLPPGCWRSKLVKLYKFTGVVYAEKEPNGEVVKVELEKHN